MGSRLVDPLHTDPLLVDPLHNGCPMMANHSQCKPTDVLQLAVRL